MDETAPTAAGTVVSGRAGLEVADIRVAFRGIQALGGVSFSAHPGEILGLIGPNGAGKTTLFDVISGLRRPDSGRVLLAGDDVTAKGPVHRSRAGIRRTFQRQQVFASLSTTENLLCAVEWRGGGGGLLADMVRLPRRRAIERRRREELRAVVDTCGLSDVADRDAGTLPIGSARMVELGRAIADPPVVLLLDEPTSGLDAAETALLAERMQALRATGRCAVLLIEHDITFVMNMCDRIVALAGGTVLAEGTTEEIRNNPVVQEAYLS